MGADGTTIGTVTLTEMAQVCRSLPRPVACPLACNHAGDLPNVHVQDDGTLATEYFTTAVKLDDGETGLFDEDGAAIVMHQGADDYQTDPAGDAGARIACAVISPTM